MGARENPVTTACCRVLDLLNVPWMRNNSGKATLPGAGGRPRPVFFGKPGWPDILGVLPDGRFLGVECKAPPMMGLYRKRAAGKRSDLQIAVHQQLAASGALVITCTSSEEMERDLKDEGYFR